jgi:hypothetical protein
VFCNYRIALMASPGGFIDRVSQGLGKVKYMNAAGWLENSDVVVVDCSDSAIPRSEKDWRRILDLGKTLGLIGMRTEEHAILDQIVGRTMKQSRKNLFVRKSTKELGRYTFTIVPELEDDKDPVEFARFLAERVFTAPTAKPVAPPEAINNLWPVNSEYGKLFASTQALVSGWDIGGNWNENNDPPLFSHVTLNAVGYFFWANGDEGDQNYHVIILSRMSNVQSLNLVPDSNSRDFGSWQFGFGFRITPSVAPLNVYSTQPEGNNSPPPPQNWGPLGDYICTNFGYNPPIEIKIKGTPPGSSEQKTFELNPTFNEYHNSVTNPGVDAFYAVPNDSSTKSEVQFNMWDSLSTIPNSSQSKMKPLQVNAKISDGNDCFVALSYFTFKNTGANPFTVNFVFDVDFFLYNTDSSWLPAQSGTPNKLSVPIDLVSATKLSPLS